MSIGKRVKVVRDGQIFYHGTLVAFGIDFEELRDGIAQFSTAIIEKDDGSLCNVAVPYVVILK
jgi:hypothetical protein